MESWKIQLKTTMLLCYIGITMPVPSTITIITTTPLKTCGTSKGNWGCMSRSDGGLTVTSLLVMKVETTTPLRWIITILHDPRYLIPWELGDYSTFRSCRILSINSRNSTRARVEIHSSIPHKGCKYEPLIWALRPFTQIPGSLKGT